jgi:hypothetical protein
MQWFALVLPAGFGKTMPIQQNFVGHPVCIQPCIDPHVYKTE